MQASVHEQSTNTRNERRFTYTMTIARIQRSVPVLPILLITFNLLIWTASGRPCQQVGGPNTQTNSGCNSDDVTKEEIVAELTSVETEFDIDPNYNASMWNAFSRKRRNKVCAHPIRPSNGKMTGTSTNIGDQYHFSCKSGFRLVGSATITCYDHVSPYGLWSDYYPYCVPSFTPADTLLPHGASCNFEDNVCGFIQDTTDDFDWTRFTGATKTRLTGPSFDNTYKQTHPGHYMYAESSSPRVPNEKARLYSLRYPASSQGYCLVFWYHMYGENVGSLNVYIKKDTMDVKSPTIHLEGNQGNTWKQLTSQIGATTKGFRIVFESVIGTGFRGDTAVDDVSIKPGACTIAPPVG